ncbi:MAG TPA: type II secretion system protein GspD, partial [Caldimonas sp.]|nr:type II secretion system protein GspD [Caldimonas sp.]
VLGGLIEDRYTENKSKVPLLGDIPYLGALFRSESRTKTRTNLMVFLRPIVMRDSETANRITQDRYEQVRAFQREMQPNPSVLVPINESPVIAPIKPAGELGQISAPQSSPGTTKPVAPKQPADATVPVVVPVIVPSAAPASAPPAASAPGG